MAQSLTTDDIASIIDKTSNEVLQRTLDDSPEIMISEDSEIIATSKKDKVTQIIESSTDEKIRKEQSEMLTDDIKKRFARLKKISKDNFNMLEVALICHKLSNDYKRLAKLNKWAEIEMLFEEK